MHWTMLMGYVRGRLGFSFEQTWAMFTARGLAAGLAAYGVYSLAALNVGTKLLMQPTMEFWDFEAETPSFFGHLAGIVGLSAFMAHYAWKFSGTHKTKEPSAAQKSVSTYTPEQS